MRQEINGYVVQISRKDGSEILGYYSSKLSNITTLELCTIFTEKDKAKNAMLDVKKKLTDRSIVHSINSIKITIR